jgi:hypothetical protein
VLGDVVSLLPGVGLWKFRPAVEDVGGPSLVGNPPAREIIDGKANLRY